MRRGHSCGRARGAPSIAAAAAIGSVVALLAALTGCASARGDVAASEPPGPTSASPTVPGPVSGPSAHAAGEPDPTAAVGSGIRPVRIRIPAIAVSSGLEVLDLTASGELEAPSSPRHAGWYGGGPAPGDIGPAVIAGHLDSRSGPAVFYRLPSLRAGDRILVERSDGATVRFVVQSVRTFPKDGFPTEDVYGATPEPVLRLITCGGAYDHGSGYRDNVIVFAVPQRW